jgi:hypothetical protein
MGFDEILVPIQSATDLRRVLSCVADVPNCRVEQLMREIGECTGCR